MTETFRLVDAGDGGRSAVLAKMDGRAGDVYTLDIFSVEDLTIEGYTQEQMALLDWSPTPGALVEVTWDGTVMESYPAQFGRSPPSGSWRTASMTCAGCTGRY